MRRLIAALGGAALVGALALTAAPADAHARPAPAPVPGTPVTLASGLLTPLSLAAGPAGSTYVTQNFAGQLVKVARNGTTKVLYSSPVDPTSGPAEVGGVSVRGTTVTFTETGARQLVKTIDARGKVRTLADVGAYEARFNPDRHRHYGIKNLPAACGALFPQGDPETEGGIPVSYTGIVDSHPYATVSDGRYTYLADAAANEILRIDRFGHIRTVAVLPGQPAKITAAGAAASGVPACAVGYTYTFEPVPTDVELYGGKLYVSTLPGGPEDAALGARGSVYTVDLRSGHVSRLATGFLGATNLAVSPKGDVYVTELFGNQVSVVRHGTHTPTPFWSTVLPAAVEYVGSSLYVTTGALVGTDQENPVPPGGAVVKVPVRTPPVHVVHHPVRHPVSHGHH